MRYALYYMPAPGSRLAVAGAVWLGHDAETGLRHAPAGDPDRVRTAARYGWHATLKAPFALASGADEAAVLAAAARLAGLFSPIAVPLAVERLAGFAALRPLEREPELRELATAAVVALAPLAAPAPPRPGLSGRAAELCRRWGYPWVFEDYRFHLTLGEAPDPAAAASLMTAARMHFADCLVADVDAISVVVEPAPGADFRVLARFPFGGGGA